MSEAPASVRARVAAAWPWTALVGASIAFRLPALVNAAQTNSDAAVVGLQAMHIGAGEWSPFLWGSGYQTSVDATWAALVFAFTGPSPLALMGSALALHVVLTCLVFATLRRRVSTTLAMWLTAPLVLTGGPSQTYILYPPRQAALTLAVASLCLLDRAADGPPSGSRARQWTLFALGGATASLACFADPYALVLVPVIAVLALLAAWSRGDRRGSIARVLAATGGAAIGVVPLLVLWSQPRASHGQVGLTAAVVGRNARLLASECLPWALGTKVYFARHVMDYAPWDAPAPVHAFQLLGAASLVVGMIAGGALGLSGLSRARAPGTSRVTWPVRRLGLAGALGLPVTIAGFLASVMVMDHFSARYLAALILVCPFALAPVAAWLGPRRFAWAALPFLATSALGGWVSYGPYVRGARPVALDAERGDLTRGDDALEAALVSRGVRYAMADYWVAYRLTFLFRERVIVVPTHEAEDRYAPYRKAFAASPRVAYVFDPWRSRERDPEAELAALVQGSDPERDVERVEVGRLRVLIVTRRDASARTAGDGSAR